MTPKSILVPFNGSKDDQSILRYALSVAEEYDASIQALQVMPDPESSVMTYPYGEFTVYPEETNENRRRTAEEAFSSIIRASGARKASFYSVVGDVQETFAIRGRVADLIIAGRTSDGAIDDAAINGILFGSARPLLLLPHKSYAGKFGDDILVAWNGSKEAAQAVAFALPYMKRGKTWILTEKDEDAPSLPLSQQDLTGYLLRHNIKADKALINIQTELNLPESILNTARNLHVGMIVMGAWGHSRLREYILGGVTRFMLKNADVPLFMMH